MPNTKRISQLPVNSILLQPTDTLVANINGTTFQTTVSSLGFASKNNPSFTGSATGITSTMVGLGNVNNTSDDNKPISIAVQTALVSLAKVLATGSTAGLTLGSFAVTGGTIIIATNGVLLYKHQAVTSFTYTGANAILLDLRGCTELIAAEIRNITNPPLFTGCTKLEYLNLGDSPLTTAPIVTGLIRLEALFLSDALYTTPTDVSTCLDLIVFFVYRGAITSLPNVTGLTKIADIRFVDCPAVNAAAVDAFYIQLATSTIKNNGYADTSGTTGNATSVSLSARNALIARGWTIVI